MTSNRHVGTKSASRRVLRRLIRSRTIVLPISYPMTIRNFEMPVDFPTFLLQNPESALALTPEIIDRSRFRAGTRVFSFTHVSSTAPESSLARDGDDVYDAAVWSRHLLFLARRF